MSDVAAPPATENATVNRYTYSGAALIALAFAGPYLASIFGAGNAYSVGQDFAGTCASLVFLAVIAWLATRNRSDLAMAKARSVVGVLLCLTVFGNMANDARDKAFVKQFLQGGLALQSQFASKSADLGKRFELVALAAYLTPEGLTSPQNVLAGQAALELYRSLLAERDLLSQTYVADSTAIVSSLPAGLRRRAESTFVPLTQANVEMYGLLKTTQTAYADAIGAVFAWAQANAGRVSMSGGKMLFQTEQQQTELTALAKKLQEAENAVNAAADKAQAQMAEAATKHDQSVRAAEAFLAR